MHMRGCALQLHDRLRSDPSGLFFRVHFEVGEQPWGGLSGNAARTVLRDTLRDLGVSSFLLVRSNPNSPFLWGTYRRV